MFSRSQLETLVYDLPKNKLLRFGNCPEDGLILKLSRQTFTTVTPTWSVSFDLRALGAREVPFHALTGQETG